MNLVLLIFLSLWVVGFCHFAKVPYFFEQNKIKVSVNCSIPTTNKLHMKHRSEKIVNTFRSIFNQLWMPEYTIVDFYST